MYTAFWAASFERLAMLSTWWIPRPLMLTDEARVADASALAKLHAGSFAQDWSTTEFEALLAQPNVFGFVVRRGTWLGALDPVSFVLGRIAADEAEILTIAVDVNRRREGLGRRTLDAAIDHAIRQGVRHIFLEVSETNTAAIALYEASGFREVARRVGYYRACGTDKTDALVMRCDLR